MFYWFAIFWDKGLRFERWFWADNYDAAKVELRKTYGSGISIEKLGRV